MTRSTVQSTGEKPIEANLLIWRVHCLQDKEGGKNHFYASHVENRNVDFQSAEWNVDFHDDCASVETSTFILCIVIGSNFKYFVGETVGLVCFWILRFSAFVWPWIVPSFKRISEVGILPWMNFSGPVCCFPQSKTLFFSWKLSKWNFRIICLSLGHSGCHNYCTSSWEVPL